MFPQKNNAAFGGTKKITKGHLMANKFAFTGRTVAHRVIQKITKADAPRRGRLYVTEGQQIQFRTEIHRKL